MEIHAPHEPILSFREFLVHLSMVTVGILIALALEQSVEAYHHHELAEEAKANMTTEIADNKRELDNHLTGLDKIQKQRDDDIRVVDQLLAHQHLRELTIGLGFSGPTLNSASWTTASSVGALAYMEYGTVKRFAEVYKLQDLYERLQNDEINDVQKGVGMLASLKDGPEKVPDSELRAIKLQLQQGTAALTVIAQVGQQLSAEYGKVLAKK
ncbi:MAG: hypothetical protein P4L56_25060 [Candidatus Sulfopaludibacter sp.]|nr:hypothetical protein [Candidatus Sulfopaludibacter sp.]